MIIEHHSIEVICNNCLSTDEIDVSDMNFDIANNDDILKVIRPLGWMPIGGNISNLLCPTCAKNTQAIYLSSNFRLWNSLCIFCTSWTK